MSQEPPSWSNKYHITSNSPSDAKAYFTQTIPSDPHLIHQPWGSVSYIYSTPVPADLNTSTHLDETNQHRTNGLPGGRVTVENGVAGAIVNFAPGVGVEGEGKVSPWHRTRSLDYGVLLQGEMQLELDGGEVRTVRVGDVVVQRGTMHKWKNVTPDGGWARMFVVGVDAKDLEVGGKQLKEEWLV